MVDDYASEWIRRRIWNELAETWTNDDEAKGLNREKLNSLIDKIKSRALIVGAGRGMLVELLRDNGIDVIGIDWSTEMIKMAYQFRRIKLIESSAHSMPFLTATFSTVVISTGVLSQGQSDKMIQLYVAECTRCLTAEGTLIVGVLKALRNILLPPTTPLERGQIIGFDSLKRIEQILISMNWRLDEIQEDAQMWLLLCGRT